MKFKKLVILLVILAALVVAGVLKKISLEKEEAAVDKAQPLVSLAKEVPQGFVSGIELYKSGTEAEKVLLVKKDSGEWALESHFGTRARKTEVERLLKSVAEMKGDLRSESSDVLGDYALLDEQAIHLRLLDAEKKEIQHYLFSAVRPQGSSNFVRLAGASQVLATENDVVSSLGVYSKEDKPDYKIFSDLQVVRTEQADIERFEIIGDKQTVVMAKKGETEKKWTFEPEDAKVEIDPTKVDAFLNSARNLYAQAALDPKGDYAFDDAKPWIRLQWTKDGKPVTADFILGKKMADKPAYALKVLPEGLAYEIHEGNVQNLSKDKASFLKDKEAKK